MSDSESAKAVLCEYYDALLKEDFDKLSSVCDDSLTVISLYGSTTVSGESNLIEMYKGIMDNFEAQGMSRRIGYDKDEFKTTDIQVNVKQIQTVLTKFNSDNTEAGTWNCTYILVKKDEKWLISLATSDNEQSTTIR
tara:strand:- start:241 stop:651 length:411 start_codon:yes stop_codon:yes gene_type:complete